MWKPLFPAAVLYLLWTAATFALEGIPRTLNRPEAIGLRTVYALIANLLIGIGGSVLVVRWALGRGIVPAPAASGFAPYTRVALTAPLGLVFGFAAFIAQSPASTDPIVVANAYAQTLVVSAAEVMVCWVVLGSTVRIVLGERPGAWAIGIVVAAVAFGAYHLAHSPPFNTWAMVGLLSGVGLLTGIFLFLSRDLFGTLLFHNFLAVKGVTDALAARGVLEEFGRPQPPLIAMAVFTIIVLVAAWRWITNRQHPPSSREHTRVY